jgi:putative ABC transport system substrate-binding protein
MKRREFITLIGGAAAWPLAARAQQPTMPVIGFLSTESPDPWADQTRAFLQGLSEAGYVEGRNVLIEYRWAEGRYDRLPELTGDLVRRQVAVIVANGPAALTAKAATSTIPVVFLTGVDPIDGGLVDSLSRPGGNLTGVTLLNVEIVPKRLELLHELVPRATTMALLINPTNPNAETIAKDLQVAARTRGLQLHVLHASSVGDFDAVFASLAQLQAAALVIGTDPFFISQSEHLASLTARHAVPAIFQFREFAAASGLISYGGNNKDQYRQVGIYTGRILKGEKPADLPVMQSTKVELIINLKSAKTLGVTVPLSLLGRADEVIE